MALSVEPLPSEPPPNRVKALERLLKDGVTHGDAAKWLPQLPEKSVDLFFTSPPYANARSYSEIHPDRYVNWFLPFAAAMLPATTDTGSFVLNIKNRVSDSGPLKGQRHPYVYELVIAIQKLGWKWIETYIWAKPNAMPGKFGPRPKDSFEYLYHFCKGHRPYFDLNAVRIPYKAQPEEITRRLKDRNGRRNTNAGFGRDRSKTYIHGSADPGNVMAIAQSYNQYRGPAGKHTAVMPEGIVEFFIGALSPSKGVVIDPFAGSGTTSVVARRLKRRAGGLELHEEYVILAQERLAAASDSCETTVNQK